MDETADSASAAASRSIDVDAGAVNTNGKKGKVRLDILRGRLVGNIDRAAGSGFTAVDESVDAVAGVEVGVTGGIEDEALDLLAWPGGWSS